jgi:hypothetical protein
LPHGAWEYGKSGYKLVQYMAASRPVIASPVGVNCDVVKEGVNGFFAITEAEWVENLERFRSDATLTASLGAAARETAETSFSLQATLPKSPSSYNRRQHSGRRRAGHRRASPSDPVWRAPPAPAAAHHPDKDDEQRT